MNPRELIEKWVEIFNQGNAEKISRFYHDDAINHIDDKGNSYKGMRFLEEFTTDYELYIF